MKAYDPFPRAPTSASRVGVCTFTRPVRYNASGVVAMPSPDAPRAKHVGKGKKRIKRIVFK